MNPTAPVSLSDTRMAEIIALSQREFDDREAKIKTTMVSNPDGPEWPMTRGYKAARSHGRAAYEIEANADLGRVMASGQALPILKDGKATAQVGALTNFQDGRGLVRFSRSEKGQEAETLYASGNAQLSISTTRTRSGQDRPVALTLRASNGASKMDNEAQTIAQLGQKHGQTDLATKAIAAGQTLAEFRSDLLETVSNTPLDVPAYIESGQRQYSLGNLIRASITGDRSKAGYEFEVAQELERNHPTGVRGTMVPWQAFSTRATMTSTSVANLTESMPRGDLFVDALQPNSAAMQAGATTLSLSKAISVPKQTGSLTASWTAEGSAVSESNLTIGTFSMSPKRLSATASYTLESLVQSDPSIDALTRRDMARMLARGIDTAAVSGSGASGQPTGITNTSGVSTATTAATGYISRDEALSAIAALEADDVDTSNAVFLMHPTDASATAGALVDAGSGEFVLSDGRILGKRVITSTLISQGTAILGDFRQLLVASFGGVDVVIDPYSAATSATVKVTMHGMHDVAVRHPQAFNVITITAAP